MTSRFKKIVFTALAAMLISKNFYTPVLVNLSPTEIFQAEQNFETA